MIARLHFAIRFKDADTSSRRSRRTMEKFLPTIT
jgi:hypothetical protein